MNELSQLAFVFPGQGSQQIGMLKDHAETWPVVKHTFEQAEESLGFDLWRMVQEGAQDTLNLTENAQPALLAASIAISRVWQEVSPARPAVVAGHSLGEWSALVFAGVIEFQDAVNIVRLRGQYMQQAVPVGVGTMAAIIGLDDEVISRCCDEAAQGQQVGAVNYNAPGQVVIAGHTDAVARAVDACKAAGAKRAIALSVSAPFHTELMRPAAQRLRDVIRDTEFRAPQIPVIHNVNAQPQTNPKAIKDLMVEQIYSPVRWVECVRAMTATGATQFLEVGPGKVLNGMIKRIDKSTVCHASDSAVSLNSAASAIAALSDAEQESEQNGK